MEQRRFPVFAERFAQLRGDKTQKEFADFLDISRPTVGFYENGTRLPDALVLRQIADKCNVSSDWLLGLTDDKTVDANIRQICNYTGLCKDAVESLHAYHINSAAFTILINDLLSVPLFLHKLLAYFASAFYKLSSEEPYTRIRYSLPHFHTLLDERIHMGVVFDSLPQERQHFFNRYKDDKYVCEQMLFELLSKEDVESLTSSNGIVNKLFKYMYVHPDDTQKEQLAMVARFLSYNPKIAYIAQGMGIDLQHFIEMGEGDQNGVVHEEN